MIDDQGFSTESAGPAPAGTPAADPAPKVVIVYRSRGLSSALIPPALILLSALLILSYERRTPLRVFPPSAITAPVPDPPPAPEPAPPPEVAAAPAAAESTPAPGPAREPASPFKSAAALAELVPVPEPPMEPATPPAEPSRAEPIARDRTAIVSDLPRDPEPPAAPPVVTREQALEEIRREAEEKEAELRRLEALKPRARELELGDLFRKAQASRGPFHAALRGALATRDPNMADAIESLCVSFGRSMPEEVNQRVNRLLKTSHARLSLKSKVETMRVWGVPEPMILDFLAHDLDRMLGTRGGPKTRDDVLIRAARLLLTMPLRPQAGGPANRPYAEAAPRTGPTPRQRVQ